MELHFLPWHVSLTIYLVYMQLESGSVTRGKCKDPLTNTAGCTHPSVTAHGVVRESFRKVC